MFLSVGSRSLLGVAVHPNYPVGTVLSGRLNLHGSRVALCTFRDLTELRLSAPPFESERGRVGHFIGHLVDCCSPH